MSENKTKPILIAGAGQRNASMIARALRDAGLELEAVGLEDGDLDRRFGYLEGFSMLTTHKQDVPYFNDSQQKRISHRKVKSKRKAQKIARRKNRR